MDEVTPDETQAQTEPPRFDDLPAHPGTDMGSVWVTGNAARRVGGERLRLWFRLDLLAATVGLVVLALR